MRVIHQMRMTARLADGADEWSCPTCGRRIALRPPPDPRLTVLDAGDESAVHIGVTEQGPSAASAEAVERYGLGPVQEIPRPPSRPRTDPQKASDAGAGTAPDAGAAPDAADRAWLAGLGIDWDGGAAA